MNIIKTIKDKRTKISNDYLINNGWFGKINYNNTINNHLVRNKIIDYMYCHKKTMGMPSGIPSHSFLIYNENDKYFLINFPKDNLTEIKSVHHLNSLIKSI